MKTTPRYLVVRDHYEEGDAHIGSFDPSAMSDARLALRYTDYRYNYPTNSGGAAVDSNAFNAQDRTVIGVDVERSLSARASATLTLGSSVSKVTIGTRTQ